MKIFDCFVFNNELDLLELRLNTLDESADFFVLVESDHSFSGSPKPLHFKKHAQEPRFQKFAPKIIHVKIDDLPKFSGKDAAWQAEYFQRNAILRGLKKARPDDLVIISDVDEIPRPEAIQQFQQQKLELAVLEQKAYYYRFNCQNITQLWRRAAIVRFDQLNKPQQIRDLAINLEKHPRLPVIKNAGWHFSYLGQEQAIQEKIQAFAHQEYNQKQYTDPKIIKEKIISGLDLFDRTDAIYRFVPLGKSFPAYLVKNQRQENFQSLIQPLNPEQQQLFNQEKLLLKFLRQQDREQLKLQHALSQQDQRIKQKDQEVLALNRLLQDREQELSQVKNSLRWKVPNYGYKLYKNKIKQFVPRGVFEAAAPLTRYLSALSQKGRLRVCASREQIQKIDYSSIQTVVFDSVKKPEASIVIPVFNNWRFTYHCLKSLQETEPSVPYEVIVIDNNSTDRTADLLQGKIQNVKIISNQKNLGFVEACNQGARAARGRYLVFLNNDTQVLPSWLSSLFQTLKNRPQAGLVGSKLIYPNGRLQEAGGVIYKNRAAANFGRLQNPDHYQFNYLKPVDYCSGASIMLPRKLFQQLGGFDQRYAPAYFEDTDLAFQVRRAGREVLYQPLSELIHYEGISAGTDTSQGMKKYQKINQQKFFSRWQKTLNQENCRDDQDELFLARDRAKNKKIILFVDYMVPAHDKEAGLAIAFEYLKILAAQGHKVIFWPHNLSQIQPYTQELQQLGIEVVYGNVSFKKFIQEAGRFLDYAFLSRPEVTRDFIDPIKSDSRAKIIYLGHDLHFLRKERQLKHLKGRDQQAAESNLAREKAAEIEIMQRADLSLFFSPAEIKLLKEKHPQIKAALAPWVQPLSIGADFDPSRPRHGLLFVGSRHLPNIDGLQWFHDQILPRLLKQDPDLKVKAVGNELDCKLSGLQSKNFQVNGFVQDLAPFFEQSQIFISPLRFGAGIKGKILKAMSYGLPVVTTSVGAEGLNLGHRQNAMIADTPAQFAKSIQELQKNRELWQKISQNSIEFVQKNYTPEAADKKIKEILA